MKERRERNKNIASSYEQAKWSIYEHWKEEFKSKEKEKKRNKYEIWLIISE